MTSYVRKVYKEALANEQFNAEAKESDPIGYRKPNMFSDSVLKHVYATTYYGWLIARGEFSREKYN